MIKRLKTWRRLWGMMICMILAAALLPATAFARGRIDTQSPVSLTIDYPCVGAAFRIYRVADVSESGVLTLSGDFKDYSVSLKQPDQTGWGALAVTLQTYAERDKRNPVNSGKIGSNGRLGFPQLTPGLYLVTGDSALSGGYRYTPEPGLVMLPGLDRGDNWISDVTVTPKYTRTPQSSGDTVDRKVLKVWKDNGNTRRRPEEITVQLLRDGEVWDTVTLDRQHNWRYEWEKLDADYNWRVIEEDVPDNYTVTVHRSGITFVITNTIDRPDRPHGSDGPGESETSSYNIPDGSVPRGHAMSTDSLMTIGDDPVPKSAALPQTGQLWWPVPILAVTGMLFVVLGLVWRRGVRDEE